MGVAADLDYRFEPANAVQRALQALAATRGGAWVFARILPPLDTWVERLTHGRHTVPGLLVGLPVVDLTTTGRRSGLPRTTHLIAVPYEDTLALLGTNFGQPSTPAWALNLEADPRATLSYRGTTVDVVARPADAAEQAAVLARSEEIYLGYRRYQSRITGRRLRVFVLERPGA
ncbi:MAG TPA: nitroreductase family deazaflavin-dependent oxidoreductase [Nocardioides sp.]|nr:nitroreductase family deazaflavin-dependent oxidoreductase [Nocardioides sp.]